MSQQQNMKIMSRTSGASQRRLGAAGRLEGPWLMLEQYCASPRVVIAVPCQP